MNKLEFAQSVSKLTHDFKQLLVSEEFKFESDCCPMKIGDVIINMQLDQLGDRIILCGYLTDLPPVADRVLLEELLTGNLYWQAGATICLEPISRSVLMLLAVAVTNLEANRLLSVARQFAADLKQARDAIEAYNNRRGPNRAFN